MTISVSHAVKTYGDFHALDDVSIDIPEGSLTALLGPSGSGKSTLLRTIAGLEQPDSGQVVIDGRDVTRLSPQDRGIGFVFQHYAAFKHMTVRDNVAFGLTVRKRPKKEIDARVDELLEIVGLAGYQTRYPSQLSGGQRQRTLIAQGLAQEAPLLLLDEPLSAVDAATADLISRAIAEEKDAGVTVIIATHDRDQATAADRVVILDRGRIVAVG
jgi:sulfate transport system ATP-binding protein